MKRCLLLFSRLLIILIISGAAVGRAQGAPLPPASSHPILAPASASLPAPRFLKILDADPLNSAGVGPLLASGSRVYFMVRVTTPNPNVTQCSWWVSDGSPDGTQPFPYFFPFQACPVDPSQPAQYLPFRNQSLLLDFNGKLYFTDGSSIPTLLLDFPALNLTSLAGTVVFFTDYDYGLTKPGVWVTDGTPAGTVQIMPLARILSTTFRIGQDVFFLVDNDTGTWLWKTDGTASGTFALAQIEATSDVIVSNPVAFNGKTYFLVTYPVQTAAGYDEVPALWGTDGTQAGTALIKTFPPTDSSSSTFFSASEHYLFFVLVNHNADYILWQSDGTPAGTQAFAGNPIFPDLEYGFTFRDAFYLADHNGVILNKTTGKAGGLVPLLNGRAFTGNGYAQSDGRLYLNNGQLWVTDGSSLTELVGSQSYQMPLSLIGFAGWLFFSPNSGCTSSGCALWFTDGTPAGTKPYPYADLGISTSHIYPAGTGAGRFYLMVADSTQGSQLWVIDDPRPIKTYLPMTRN